MRLHVGMPYIYDCRTLLYSFVVIYCYILVKLNIWPNDRLALSLIKLPTLKW